MAHDTILRGDMMRHTVNRLYIVAPFTNPDINCLRVGIRVARIAVFKADPVVRIFITDNLRITVIAISMAPAAVCNRRSNLGYTIIRTLGAVITYADGVVAAGALLVAGQFRLMMGRIQMAFQAVALQYDTKVPVMLRYGMAERACSGIKLRGFVVGFNKGITMASFTELLVQAGERDVLETEGLGNILCADR